ncbi:hypothetical protein K8R04_03855 [Candidatus Uhrbacteria bacterium]|nr:hypothetical protein [Candidatus Uhrbacteria bacterium]
MESLQAGSRQLPSIPEFIAKWHSWSPHLCRPDQTDDLVMRCEEARAFSEATGVTMVGRETVGDLNKFSWKGIDTIVRERCFSLVEGSGIDGYLMRAHLNSLYPGSLSISFWERLFHEPSTITVRSQLMENIRILLFYVTVLSSLEHSAEAGRLKAFLDLAYEGFLPLGVSQNGGRLLVLTG